ncbi:Hypothetical_protein [Hexamita inflata]|uniref:Hypothetical_protein n=1 Tax=Hexamita inflata TaxID=28002 RepID=A0ABP1H6A0_9EUKA
MIITILHQQPKDGQNEQKRQLTQNRKPSRSQRKPKRRSSKQNIRNSLSNNRELRKISKQINPRKQLIYHRQYIPKLGICKIKQTKKDPRYLIVNETMHQRQPPPSNANTTEQPPVQAEGNNEQRETETREPVSGNQVSELGETGLTLHSILLLFLNMEMITHDQIKINQIYESTSCKKKEFADQVNTVKKRFKKQFNHQLYHFFLIVQSIILQIAVKTTILIPYMMEPKKSIEHRN